MSGGHRMGRNTAPRPRLSVVALTPMRVERARPAREGTPKGEYDMRGWWIGLIAAAIITVAPPVSAQEQQSPAPTPAPTPAVPSQDIPDQKLDAAAAALDRIVNVQETYQKQIAQASKTDHKQRLSEEANGAILKAVTDHGLSVEEYTQILVVARNDPVVRQKIIQRIRPPEQ